MIDAKEAAKIAKHRAAEMLDRSDASLEEIERDSYKDRDVWIVTLGFLRDFERMAPLLRLGASPTEYKRFFIDVETGDLVAIRLRELALR